MARDAARAHRRMLKGIVDPRHIARHLDRAVKREEAEARARRERANEVLLPEDGA